MHETSCPHGYIPSSCAECRENAAQPDRAVTSSFERFTDHWEVRPRSEWTERRALLLDQVAQLKGYVRRSNVQDDELVRATEELAVLDTLVSDDDIRVRSANIDRVRRAYQDPANREGQPDVPGMAAPALIGDRNRAETADETISRMRSNPWRSADSGPLTGRTESVDGLIARAHSALEGLNLPHDGSERLAQAFADSYGWPGMTVKRSRDEQAEAAAAVLALSSPYYLQAFRSVLRFPSEFMGAGATGFETMSPDERQAWRDVRTNYAVRAAFAETSGAAGAFALPLQLDPTVMVINAGVVGPFRKLARQVVGTSNVWEGVTSQGTTANWVGEGVATADTTPTIAQVAITPNKSAVWVFGSLEIAGDTNLDAQVPMLVAEARSRLELTAFTTGPGTTAPFGVVTRGASDATVGVLTNAMVYNLHQSLPPRFRSYDTARPAWLANVAIINALRQLPAFAGANYSIVNDNGDMPTVLGLPIYEASAMDASNVVSGHKNLLIGDFSQMIIVERVPAIMIYDPLVLDQASARPSGQVGWYSYARVGSDITTPAAAFGSNAFNFHTT